MPDQVQHNNWAVMLLGRQNVCVTLQLQFFECECVASSIDSDCIPFGKLSSDDFGGQLVFQLLLDDTFERSCTKRRVVAFVYELILGGVREFDGEPLSFQPGGQIFKLDNHNLFQIISRKRTEDN
jgi:hypothetical protein